jgi:hypothetical protein
LDKYHKMDPDVVVNTAVDRRRDTRSARTTNGRHDRIVPLANAEFSTSGCPPAAW